MSTLSISSLNTQGCSDSLKRSSLFHFLKLNLCSDIFFLQDTHTTLLSESLWQLIWRGNILFSHLSSSEAGIAVLLKPNSQIETIEFDEIVKGRAIYVKISFKSSIFHIINLYAPTCDKERSVFFSKILTFLDCLQSGDDPIVFSGDFNCTLDPKVDRSSGKEHHTASPKVLMQIIQQYDLCDCHRHVNNNLKMFTWRNKCGSASRIDRLYVSDFKKSSIISFSTMLCPFSDHCAVCVVLRVETHHARSTYWKFNTDFLRDAQFISVFKIFWRDWSTRKKDYDSLLDWWDLGKVKIRQICQDFGKERAFRYKQEKIILEKEIVEIEQTICKDSPLTAEYNSKYELLRSLYKRTVVGAQIRARFHYFNEADTSSSYFFNLEKKSSKFKCMSHLHLDDGRTIVDKKSILLHARKFYSDLYSPDPVDVTAQDVLLSDLTQVSRDHALECDRDIAFGELSCAVAQLNNNRAPGLDGLPAEFYKAFWDVLGKDLYAVLLYSLESDSLPLSCRRAIITLIPKQGDNGYMKNCFLVMFRHKDLYACYYE